LPQPRPLRAGGVRARAFIFVGEPY
jgi:hypothetical protein